MNNFALIFLIISFIIFIIVSVFWERLSVKNILKNYLNNFKGG